MNSEFWHRQWIRALSALLLMLCAGFSTLSLAGGHSHCDEPPGAVSTASPIGLEPTVSVTPPNHHQLVAPETLQEDASAMNNTGNAEQLAHGGTQSSETCLMPCDGALPCSPACALACATSGVSVIAIPFNVALPQDWVLKRVPTPDDVDAIVEVTLPPLYRPPIS